MSSTITIDIVPIDGTLIVGVYLDKQPLGFFADDDSINEDSSNLRIEQIEEDWAGLTISQAVEKLAKEIWPETPRRPRRQRPQ